MKTSQAFFVAVSLAVLAACSPEPKNTRAAPPTMTAEIVRQKTKLISDPYTRVQFIRGPMLGDFFATGYYLTYGRATGASITLSYSANNWAFLSRAHDSSGEKLILPFEPSRHVEVGGKINEFVSISLPERYLAEHADTGIDIRVDGSRGMVFVKFPPAYVQGFLAAVAAYETD